MYATIHLQVTNGQYAGQYMSGTWDMGKAIYMIVFGQCMAIIWEMYK